VKSISHRRWTAWIPALLVATLIFVLSSIPGQELPAPAIPGFDKLAHGGIYAVLGCAVALGLHRGAGVATRGRLIALGVVAGAVYGASDEFHQIFTPHRAVEVLDGVADTIGSLIGSVVYAAWQMRRGGERRTQA
jgi:VanZ family protein